jgi:hypothetical protein
MTAQPFRLIIEPSQPRRVAGVAMLTALGAITLLLALARPPEAIGLRAAFLLGGLGALWFARRLWRATASGLVLDAAGLREAEGQGRTVVAMDGLLRVERGPFAFKPSNGFLLKTRIPGPGVWRPGVWWRIGRRVGVGGVLNAAHARAAAEVLEAAVLSTPPSRTAGRSGDA